MFRGLRRVSTRRTRVLGSTLAFAAASAASPAAAGTFTGDGTFLFDSQAVARVDFEDPGGAGGAGGGGSVTGGVADEHALSGAQVRTLGAYEGIDLPVDLPKVRATYRVSAWIRDGEAVGSVEIAYGDRTDEVAALYPTGRVTSDGWIELANDHLRVDGARLVSAKVGFFSAGGATLDAVEVVRDGGAEAFPDPPNAKCGGATDPSACGEGQVCIWSECRTMSGQVPPIPTDRDVVTDYLENRIRLLFGPYLERTLDVPAALVSIQQMRSAKDRWTYWNGFMTAVRKLHDGHTSTSGVADFVLRNPRPLALCFLEGDADLTHDTAAKDPEYLDVLVSHTGGDHNLGLKAGDRLVRVDGQHPIAWARSLIGVNWSQPSISNHNTFAELASALRGMISRYAREIEVIRCDAAGESCGAIEKISIEDLPFEAADAPVDQVVCDNRPLRHLPTSPKNHATGEKVYSGIVNESDDVEKIHGLEWESLYTTTGSDGVGSALSTAVKTWKAGARGVILDHRTGFGGTILAPEILWNFAVPRHASDFYIDRSFGEEEQPTVAEGLALFDFAVSKGLVQYAGSSTPVTDVPVALLVTEDVSASDWLPHGMKGAPKVKIFGPFETNGGFSTRYAFGYWLGLNYVLAVGDTVIPDGTTHNGYGVAPDVVVLPKQSDLLQGKDSVYEAALAWVREELKP